MSRPAGVPNSATPGRRSIGAAVRLSSTRPLMLPGRAAATVVGQATRDTKGTEDTKDSAIASVNTDTAQTLPGRPRPGLCVRCSLCVLVIAP